MEQSASSVALLDSKGKVEYVNPKLLEAYKISRDEVIGKQWNFFLSKNSSLRENLQEIGNTVLKKGMMWKGMISGIDESGKKMWRESRIFPIKNENGELIHTVYTSEDVTDRINAEEALRESQARLESIIHVAPIGIGVVSDRILQTVNDRLCEMTGFSKEELIGQSARAVYPSDEEFERVGREKYDDIRKYGTGSIETKFMRKDGEIIDVLLSSTPLNTRPALSSPTRTTPPSSFPLTCSRATTWA